MSSSDDNQNISCRWEDLYEDCLVNVFERLQLPDMLLGVPSVCKSWYKASLNPICWRVLNLHTLPSKLLTKPDVMYERQLPPGFIKLLVSRSQKSVVQVKISFFKVTSEDLVSLSECPTLRVLELAELEDRGESLSRVIGKWKKLEKLHLHSIIDLNSVLSEAVNNCQNLSSLVIYALSDMRETAEIIAKITDLKVLNLSYCRLEKDELLVILKSCRKLEELHLADCYCLQSLPFNPLITLSCGVDVDEEIMAFTSSINKFVNEWVCDWSDL